MSAPVVIYGPSAQTLWWEASNGDLLCDAMDGTGHILAFAINSEGLFAFSHDDLEDMKRDGTLRGILQAGNLDVISFRAGAVPFEVVSHEATRDIYFCRPIGH